MKVILLSLLSTILWATDYWPTRGQRTRSFSEAGIDTKKFQLFTQYAFSGEERGIKTHAIVVIKDGHLVYEQYAHGFTKDNKQVLWSISKSITGTLVGIAQSQGKLKITQLVSQYLKVPANKGWQTMRIDDLLRMSSGIRWREKHENDPTNSDVIDTTYGLGRKNVAEYILSLPIHTPPGKVFSLFDGQLSLFNLYLGKGPGRWP